MSLPLVIKYRPKSFEEVIGHEDMLMALLRAISSDTCPHSFLFTGVSGLGKTTLARITAMELQADPLEIDAASNNGVDATRGLVELGQHMSMVGDGRRAIIIDECHTLSKQAWQPLLKLLEEPPDHLYIMLCTTELEKVPDTIRNRCFHVVLKPLHHACVRT
jgi:DNA polymerase-3 subunit gamma/tau